MKNNALMLSLLCLGKAPIALAQLAVNYDGSIESGYYHDSGLVVTAVDQSEQDSDTGFKNQVRGQVDWAASPKWQLSVGGQWQEHNYQRRNEYDQQLYLAHAGASYSAGKNRIGLSQHFAHSRLQGEALLDFSLTGIDWGRRLGDKHYLRLAVMNRTKDFTEQNARDADANGVSVDWFWFANTNNRVISNGAYWRENAEDSNLSFEGWTTRLAVQHERTLWGVDQRWTAEGDIEQRNYDSADSREDLIYGWGLSWELDISRSLQIKSDVKTQVNESDLPGNSYEQRRFSTALTWQF